MHIRTAGLLKTTLIDYPGLIASSIFLPGCNLRCPYCHNPDLALGKTEGLLKINAVFDHLIKRKSIIQGVCITGGEPLIYPDLPDLISEIKKLGYKVKLDTNGSFPERIMECGADYTAMDIKTDPEKYSLLNKGIADETLALKIRKSIQIIMDSAMDYEFRTTLVPGIVNFDDMSVIAGLTAGCRRYTLNRFSPDNTLDKSLQTLLPYTEEQYMSFLAIISKSCSESKIRGSLYSQAV